MSSQVSLPPHPRAVIEARRKRHRVVLLVCGVLLIGIWIFWGKPIYRAMKGWRARRLAAQSEQFMNEKKWREAEEAARAAYQLKSDEVETLRAVAHLQSRTGNAAG